MTATRKTKTRRARPASATLRLDADEVAHVGLDVPKASWHVAAVTDPRGPVATWTRPAGPELPVERLDATRAQLARVVPEAGPTGFAPVRRLRDAGAPAEVIAPSTIPAMPGPEAEGDRLDRRKPAALAREGPPRPVRVPDEREEADRQVVRLRERLARELRVVQRRIKALPLQHGIAEPAGLAHWAAASGDALRRPERGAELRCCLGVMRDERRHAPEQVARVGRRPEERSKADRHRETTSALRTAPGVGPIAAMTFRVARHEPERLRGGGQVARMSGPAPPALPSGPTRRGGRLRKSGDARRRAVLIEAAWRWVAGAEAAKARYRRRVASAGDGKEAIVGMARRPAILLWRLSPSGAPHRAAA